MNRFAAALLDIADVILSTVTNGDVRVNIGDSTTNAGVDASVPVFGTDGFVSRPNDADADGAATAIYGFFGDQKIVIGSRDRRYASKVGNLLPGDRAIVSKGNARFLLKNARDAVTLYTEAQSGGTSMLVSIDGQAGKVTAAHGLNKVEIGEKTIELSINGGPAIILDGNTNSITIRANTVNIDGGFVTLGLLPGGVRPTVLNVQSVLYGVAGQVGVPSQTVLVAI